MHTVIYQQREFFLYQTTLEFDSDLVHCKKPWVFFCYCVLRPTLSSAGR